MCKPGADFFKAVSTSGLVLLGSQSVESQEFAIPGDRREANSILLRDGWEFRLDPDGTTAPSDAIDGADGWKGVQMPHTWQCLGRSPDYVGIAWYRIRFEAPSNWSSQHVRIEFEAVNHTAHVFLNGKAVGEHVGKGYTAFTLDLSPHLNIGAENTLLVRVDNRPNDRMLPRNKSYDWAHDGGLIRPVNLLVTGRCFMERVEVDALPDLALGSAEIASGRSFATSPRKRRRRVFRPRFGGRGARRRCCILARSMPLLKRIRGKLLNSVRRQSGMPRYGTSIPHIYIRQSSNSTIHRAVTSSSNISEFASSRFADRRST